MKFKVTEATNFVRVFKVPDEFSSEYCFGGQEHLSEFFIIDWFNPFDQQDFWEKDAYEVDTTDSKFVAHIEKMRKFIKGKQYFDPSNTYMAMTDYGYVFIINPEKRALGLEKQMTEIKARINKSE